MAATCLVACSTDAGGDQPELGASTRARTAVSRVLTHDGLRLSGGYVEQPASPDVAAAYLTVTNTTSLADTLLAVTTNVTATVTAMGEQDSNGVGSMTDLAHVVIPAHDTYRFEPDHAHLMLEHPSHLVAGQHVRMTLTFQRAGTMTVWLPVVPLLR